MRTVDKFKINRVATSLAVFMESYNQSVPLGFPRPSIQVLKAFQVLHPALFKNTDEWSIDKHRKRIMDWLPSHNATA